MSNIEDMDILRVAKKLVGRFPKEMDNQLTHLIQRAEKNQDPTAELDIMDFLSSHENVQRWMKEQMLVLDGNRGFSPLAGDSSAPVSNKWICPKDKTESLPVIQEGEPAPQCKKHKISMVRKKQ